MAPEACFEVHVEANATAQTALFVGTVQRMVGAQNFGDLVSGRF
jgi:hypothetical protein